MTEYLDVDEIVDDWFGQFADDSIRAAAKINYDTLTDYHHGTGRDIRNVYEMWAKDNPHTDITDANSPIHPDQYSMLVMKKVLAKCKKWVEEND